MKKGHLMPNFLTSLSEKIPPNKTPVPPPTMEQMVNQYPKQFIVVKSISTFSFSVFYITITEDANGNYNLPFDKYKCVKIRYILGEISYPPPPLLNL